MAEGRISQIMRKACGLDNLRGNSIAVERFVEMKHNAAPDLRDFHGMRQPRPVKVIFARQKNLRFALQAAEGAAMDNAVPVP